MQELRLISVDMIETKKHCKNRRLVDAMLARARAVDGGSEHLGIVIVRPQSGVFPRYDTIKGADVVFAARELGNPGVWALVLHRESNEQAILSAIESLTVLASNYDETSLVETDAASNARGGEGGHQTEYNNGDPVAFARLVSSVVDEEGSQHAAAAKLRMSRSKIQNALRLMKLPSKVLAAVSEGQISAGAARALSYVKDENQLERLFLALKTNSLSVRQIEEVVAGRMVLDDVLFRDIEIRRLESIISERIGAPVRIGIKDRQSGVVTLSLHESLVAEVIEKLMDSGYQSPDVRVTSDPKTPLVKVQIAFQSYDALSTVLASLGYMNDSVDHV